MPTMRTKIRWFILLAASILLGCGFLFLNRKNSPLKSSSRQCVSLTSPSLEDDSDSELDTNSTSTSTPSSLEADSDSELDTNSTSTPDPSSLKLGPTLGSGTHGTVYALHNSDGTLNNDFVFKVSNRKKLKQEQNLTQEFKPYLGNNIRDCYTIETIDGKEGLLLERLKKIDWDNIEETDLAEAMVDLLPRLEQLTKAGKDYPDISVGNLLCKGNRFKLTDPAGRDRRLKYRTSQQQLIEFILLAKLGNYWHDTLIETYTKLVDLVSKLLKEEKQDNDATLREEALETVRDVCYCLHNDYSIVHGRSLDKYVALPKEEFMAKEGRSISAINLAYQTVLMQEIIRETQEKDHMSREMLIEKWDQESKHIQTTMQEYSKDSVKFCANLTKKNIEEEKHSRTELLLYLAQWNTLKTFYDQKGIDPVVQFDRKPPNLTKAKLPVPNDSPYQYLDELKQGKLSTSECVELLSAYIIKNKKNS